MREYLVSKILALPSTLPTLNIADHAEKYRVIPAGTPRPGPLEISYTEYLREPISNMSPKEPTQRTVIMKGAQLGFTMAAECIVCYYIGYNPADQLFISSTEANLERWANRRLEPAISSYGYRGIIKNINNTSGKKLGDKTFSKQYFGMRLDMASAQSPSSLRATDKKILIRDEVDGAPAKLKTGEGGWLDVSYARTNAWANRRKVFDLSTPTSFEFSEIWKAYQEGDQRKFNVPCPSCQKKQVLEFENLIPEREDGQVVSVAYGCIHCGELLYEYQKDQMIPYGVWIPTARATTLHTRSYQISSMYSPLGMLPWLEMFTSHEKASLSADPTDIASFTNLYLGLPHKEQGLRPKLQKVLEHKGTYKSGVVPDMVLFITIGIDVQRGSAKDKKNPARLELEVLGHGPGYRTFSIMYKRIEGDVVDAYSGAWESLNDWAIETGLTFLKKDGRKISSSLVFVDSGDGTLTNVVYQFCDRWNSTFPIKGFKSIGNDRLDKSSASDFKRYKRSRVGEDTSLFNISTNYYKNQTYNNLKISRKDAEQQSPGFCDFPADYTEKYFKMLTAEEKRTDGSFYCPDGKRNEALDVRCYASCAADVHLDALVDKFRKAAKAKGVTDQQLTKINRKFIIDYLKNQMGVTD